MLFNVTISQFLFHFHIKSVDNTEQRNGTGCFRMTAKKFELITRARKQPITWERCHFVH